MRACFGYRRRGPSVVASNCSGVRDLSLFMERVVRTLSVRVR